MLLCSLKGEIPHLVLLQTVDEGVLLRAPPGRSGQRRGGVDGADTRAGSGGAPATGGGRRPPTQVRLSERAMHA